MILPDPSILAIVLLAKSLPTIECVKCSVLIFVSTAVLVIYDLTLDLLVVSIVHSDDMLSVTVTHVEASTRVVDLLILILVIHLLFVHHLRLSLICFTTRQLPMLMMVLLSVSIDLVKLDVLQLLFVQSQLLLDYLLEEFVVQRLEHLLPLHVILVPILVDGLWMRQLLAVGI